MNESNIYFEQIQKLRAAINSVFVGKEDVVDKVLICLLAGGHVLLEDMPGIGKTTLANTLARCIQCSFGRIQFTPDTLPSDVLGVSLYNMKTQEFEYREGVIRNQILLADEINRTSPKTQACLLEAMAEGRITVDGTSYELAKPFLVIATQNPIEFLGTYPLPEAQLDRFMMRLSIGYPDKEQEIQMALQQLQGITPDTLEPVCTAKELLQLKEMVAQITVSEGILAYIADIVELTRKEPRFRLGASPRAMLALVRASQSEAFLKGRSFVKPDDVKQMALPVLLHRISLTSEARIQKEDAQKILHSLVLKVRVPV